MGLLSLTAGRLKPRGRLGGRLLHRSSVGPMPWRWPRLTDIRRLRGNVLQAWARARRGAFEELRLGTPTPGHRRDRCGGDRDAGREFFGGGGMRGARLFTAKSLAQTFRLSAGGAMLWHQSPWCHERAGLVSSTREAAVPPPEEAPCGADRLEPVTGQAAVLLQRPVATSARQVHAAPCASASCGWRRRLRRIRRPARPTPSSSATLADLAHGAGVVASAAEAQRAAPVAAGRGRRSGWRRGGGREQQEPTLHTVKRSRGLGRPKALRYSLEAALPAGRRLRGDARGKAGRLAHHPSSPGPRCAASGPGLPSSRPLLTSYWPGTAEGVRAQLSRSAGRAPGSPRCSRG